MREKSRARLAEAIAREIADILDHEAKDPVLIQSLPTILGVRLSQDAEFAKILVYVSGTAEERERVMEAFSKDTGFFRTALAHRLRVRRVPKISFVLDTSPDEILEGLR